MGEEAPADHIMILSHVVSDSILCATALLSRVFNLNFIFSAIADLARNLRAKLPFFPAIFMDRTVGWR